MNMQISGLRAIAAASLLLLTASASHAVVLDWSTAPAWSGTSNSYNVDGVAGNDISVAYTNTNATFVSPYPQITTINTPAATDLVFRVNPMGTLTTDNITVTITFIGAYAGGVITSFTLNDVDSDTGFTDQINVSALRGATPVTVTLGNSGGTSVNQIFNSPGTGPYAVGLSPTASNPNGDVNVSAGTLANPVTSITFVWSNPSTNRTTQTIGLGNITFVPEVASSSAALSLCGGLLAFRRRRSQRAAA